jgi:hypothetical protein
MFQALASRRLPEGTQFKSDEKSFCDEEGNFRDWFKLGGEEGYSIKLDIFPNPLQVFVTTNVQELSNFTKNFVKVLRWRTNVSGPHLLPHYGVFEWSIDGNEWFSMPEHFEAKELEWADVMDVSEEVQNDLKIFYETRVEQPLGHELFYEAWDQRLQNPRSALMLGIAALEVGVKECITTLVPDTKWLLDNLASPPVEKLLKLYFPELPVKNSIQGKALAPPAYIMEEIKKGVTLRNQLTHKGAPPLEYETLRDILLAVKDVIWLCNYYMGFEWSWKYLRRDMKLALDPDTPVKPPVSTSPLL